MQSLKCMKKKEETGSIFSIEVLRGFAVLLVTYFHGREVAWIGTKGFLHANQNHFSITSVIVLLMQPVVFGSIGVPIFFVLSGYCIHRNTAISLSLNIENKNESGFNATFLLRRFIRIYPVLIFALILTFLLDRLCLQYTPVNEKIQNTGWKVLLVNLFSIQGIGGHSYGSNLALWSLAIEVQFYCMYPILLWLRKLIGYHKVFVFIIIVNGISWILFPDLKFFTAFYFSWYLGFYIAEVKANHMLEHISKRLSLNISIVLICCGCILMFLHKDSLVFNLWALGFALYFWYLLDTEYSKNVITKFLASIGKISFSLYATHLPVFVLLVSYFYHSKKPLSIIPSLFFLVVTILFAYLFSIIIERPSMMLLSKLKNSVKYKIKSSSPVILDDMLSDVDFKVG